MDCASTDVCFAGGTNTVGAALILLRSLTPPPTITALTPAFGTTAGGTSVTITGTNLTGTLQVRFGSKTAISYSVQSATTVKAMTGAHAAGMVNVSVDTTHGTVTMANAFSYVSPVPTITSLTPASGTTAGGTAVTITGTHLTGSGQVKFGGMTATSFSVENPTTIRAVTNAHGAGRVSVAVHTAHGTAALETAFSFVAPVPPARSAGYDMVGSDGGVFVFTRPAPQAASTARCPASGVTVSHRGHGAHAHGSGLLPGGGGRRGLRLRQRPVPGFASRRSGDPGRPSPASWLPTQTRATSWSAKTAGSSPSAQCHSWVAPGQGCLGRRHHWDCLDPYRQRVLAGLIHRHRLRLRGRPGARHSQGHQLAGLGHRRHPDRRRYWIATQNGTVHAFGNAPGFGTLPALGVTPGPPVIGIVQPPTQAGTG